MWGGGGRNGAYARYRSAGESRVKELSKTGLWSAAVPAVVVVSRHNKFNQAKKQILRHNSLQHWGLKETHKYIAKIKRSNGTFRYFYDKGEYEAFLKGSDKFNFGDTSLYENMDEWMKGKIPSSKEHKLADNFTNFVNDFEKQAATLANVASSGITGKIVSSALSNTFLKDIAPVRQAEKAASGIADFIATKHPKYVGKVLLPNGSYRYFYDQNEYDSCIERGKYQATEPDFMKNIPELSPDYDPRNDKVFTNPNYDPNKILFSTNCWLCSNTYELRKRGYDVQASGMDSSKKDLVSTEVDSSLNPTEYYRQLTQMVQRDMSQWYENPVTVSLSGVSVARDVAKSLGVKSLGNGSILEKALRNDSGPNTRGQINVVWNGGGGHSMVYEIDQSNNITVVDSQTHKEYKNDDLKRLASRFDYVCYTRTDNLTLKEGILENTNRR